MELASATHYLIPPNRETVPVGLVLLDKRVAGDEVAWYGSGFHPSTSTSSSSSTDTSAPSSTTGLSRKTHADQGSFKTFLLWDERFHFGWKLHILQRDKWKAITITPWAQNIHPSIHQLHCLSVEGRGGAGANPSWHYERRSTDLFVKLLK